MRFLVITMLLSLITSRCLEGCLKCTKGACSYCDLQSGMRLVAGKCEKFTLENCKFFNNLGSCMTCHQDYHLDFATKKCIKILSQDIIENCLAYSSTTACSVCQKDFYLGAGKCEPIENPIEQCEIESSQKICQKCEKGNVLSVEKTNCIAVPEIEQCATFSNISCDSCSSNFLLNRNDYLNSIFGVFSSAQQEQYLKRDVMLSEGYVDSRKYNTCIQQKISHCLVFTDFNHCRVCASGYFLDTKGICQEYPLDRINNCERYLTLTECIQCQQGYWMSEEQCIAVKQIKDCKLYSPLKGNCSQCQDTHFLIGYNNCSLRSKQEIEFCLILNSEKESCKECQNTYRLTDDNSKCLPLVNDCSVYSNSNYLTTSHQCKICNEGYYYKQVEMFCSKGEKENCLIYERNENSCQQCQNKFYLEKGNCLPHDVLPACEEYHPSIKNVCFKCNFETFYFKQRNSCVDVTTIENCYEFESPSVCRMCSDGYYLDIGECKVIPVSENCLQRNKTQCSKCLKDFVLEEGVCRDPQDYIVNECEDNNVDGTVDYRSTKCNYCKQDRVPFNYKDTYICVENDYMKYIQKKTTLESDCLQYKEDVYHKFTCEKCVFGKVVDEGVCKDSCPNNKTLYKQLLEPYNKDANRLNESFSIKAVNTCGPLIENCRVAAPDLHQIHQSTVTYSCIECQEGKLAEIEFGKRAVLIRDSNEQLQQYGDSPLSYYPAQTCLDLANNLVLGDTNSQNLIDQCQYYIDLGLTKGCAKCNHGYSGVVLNVVNQCEIYEQNQFTCKQCKQGFYKVSPYECKAVNEVINCKKYSPTSNVSECIECDESFYVHFNLKDCQTRNISLNKQNCTAVDNLDSCTCNDGFFNFNSQVGSINCVQKPNHCITAVNDNSTARCALCDETSSYRVVSGNNFMCVAGGITNCNKYKIDQSFCLECEDGYYQNDGACISHATLNNCSVREKFTKNTCETCEEGYAKFKYNTRCVSITKIDNCLSYDTTETCSLCEEGYRLENIRKRCIAIPTSSNCKVQIPVNVMDTVEQEEGHIDTYDAMNLTEFVYTCDKCNEGYYRMNTPTTFVTNTKVIINGSEEDHPNNNQQLDITDANNITTSKVFTCQSYFNTFIQNCSKHNLDGLIDFESKAQCDICDTDYMIEDIADDRYICMDRKYIITKYETNKQLDYCNRVRYDKGLLQYVCEECTLGYYLSDTNECVETCDTDFEKHIGIFQQTTINAVVYSQIDSMGKCVDFSAPPAYVVTDCEIYSSDSTVLTNTAPICVKCKANHIAVLKYDEQIYSKYNTYSDVFDITNPIAQYPSISQCLDPSGLNILGNKLGTDSIPDCKYYDEQDDAGTKYYGCQVCELGKSGVVTQETNGVAINNFLNSCDTITDCDMASPLNLAATTGSQYYPQITDQPIWNKLFSCFKCTGNKIPVFHAKFTTSLFSNLEPYGILSTTGPANYNATTGQNSVVCRQLYDATTGDPLTATPAGDIELFNFAAGQKLFETKNCALAIVNTSTNGDVSAMGSTAAGWTNGLGCAACDPGFAPVRANISTAATTFESIDSCAAIEHCITNGNSFNSCEKCIHYLDHASLSTEIKIDFSICVKPKPNLTVDNCFAAYYSGPCQICQKGYQKDTEGICQQVTAPNCTNYSLQKNAYQLYGGDGIMGVSPHIPYLLYQETTKGCQVCDSTDNISTKVDTLVADRDPLINNFMCTINKANPLNIEDVKCLKYGYDSITQKNICKECKTTHLLTMKNECTLLDPIALSNCVKANEINGTTCIDCEDGYLNVAGTCVNQTPNPISNCKENNKPLSLINPFPYCSVCDDGYFVSEDNTECKEIPLPNCAEWKEVNNRTMIVNGQTVQRKWCTKCKTNFALIEKKNEEQYCYPISVSSNSDNQNKCVEWDTTNFTKRELTCTKCLIDTTNTHIIATTSVSISTECMVVNQFNTSQCNDYDTETTTTVNQYDNTSVGTFHINTFKCQSCNKSNNPDDPYQLHYYNVGTATCNTRTQVNNCKQHYMDKDECQVCVDNYILENNVCISIKAVGVNPKNKGYIQQCHAQAECESQVRYDGAHLHLNSLLSCHKCNSTSDIPFIGLRVDQDTFMAESLQQYGFTGANLYEGSGNKAVQCMSPTSSTFNLTSANFIFPANCGIGIINSHSPLSARDSSLSSLPNALSTYQIGIYCGACKPGFSATKTTRNSQDFAYMVNTCTAIPNCSSSDWFNNCSQCDPSYSYKYTDLGIKFDQCIQFTENPNCFAVDNTTTVKKCRMCKQGYVLNVDHYCEALTAPRCSQFKFSYRQHYHKKDLAAGLVLQGDGLGCQQCDDGFVGFYTSETTLACTASPYHTQKLVTATSNYIHNCLNYKVTKGMFKCQKCQPSSVLTIEGKCVSSSNLTNCELSIDSQRCRKCKQGFVVVDRLCVSEGIQNCQLFGYDDQSFNQNCLKCQEGYYLDDNKCQLGKVFNCKIFKNESRCLECLDGYGLVQTENSENYCYPITEKQNCQKVDDDVLRYGEFKCEQCNSNQFVKVVEKDMFVPGVCMSFQQTQNCKEYKKNRYLDDSSFLCSECQDEYFLKGTSCSLRIKLDKECSEYDKVEDNCLKCKEGFFLTNNECKQYPDGVPNCKIYLSKIECLICKTGYFIRNKECHLISSEVLNCNLYEDQYTCKECNEGYMIVEGGCVTVEATDCSSYETIYSCKTCPSGKGFKLSEDGKLLNCIDKGISNCLESEDYEPYKCLKCETGFYSNEGSCTQSSITIENCITYETVETCRICQKGTALSQDKKLCVSTPEVVTQLDTNCSVSYITEQPTCNTCKNGYFFKHGYCTVCKNNTVKQGCQSCDPYNQDICMICISGYY